MTNVKFLLIIGAVIAILLFGSSLYKNFDGWLQTQLNGPEYCFSDITQSEITVASQGVQVSYTKTEGDQLCFRTKDSSIPERINQQIQDRKLEAELARIESQNRFWNETFPTLFILGLLAIVIIFIVLYFSNRSGGYYI